jgi:hypothetical protein
MQGWMPVTHGERMIYVDELSKAATYRNSAGILAKTDWVHDSLFMAVQSTVQNLDGRFAADEASRERVPVSRFRLGLFAEVAEEAEEDTGRTDTKLGFYPDLEIDIQTPNVDRRLSLFLTTEELGELPGTDPDDRDQGMRMGLRRELPAGVSASAGVKWHWPPEPFARIGWAGLWRPGEWKLYPATKGFWKLEDGVGSSANFTGDRWFGPGLFRCSTGLRWTETSENVEWSQTLILGYAREMIDESKMGGRAEGRDLARGSGFRYRITGETETGEIQTHQGTLFFKVPLRKRWAYLVLSPEVTFRNESDWEAELGVLVGLDMLFWNVGER